MSIHDENAQAVIEELELNKETLQDLEVDGRDVRGGAGLVAATQPMTTTQPVYQAQTSIRLNPSGG